VEGSKDDKRTHEIKMHCQRQQGRQEDSRIKMHYSILHLECVRRWTTGWMHCQGYTHTGERVVLCVSVYVRMRANANGQFATSPLICIRDLMVTTSTESERRVRDRYIERYIEIHGDT
jgi:hypothetical protein